MAMLVVVMASGKDQLWRHNSRSSSCQCRLQRNLVQDHCCLVENSRALPHSDCQSRSLPGIASMGGQTLVDCFHVRSEQEEFHQRLLQQERFLLSEKRLVIEFLLGHSNQSSTYQLRHLRNLEQDHCLLAESNTIHLHSDCLHHNHPDIYQAFQDYWI